MLFYRNNVNDKIYIYVYIFVYMQNYIKYHVQLL